MDGTHLEVMGVRFPRATFGIVILIVFGYLAFLLLEYVQGRVSPWYQYQLEKEVEGMGME